MDTDALEDAIFLASRYKTDLERPAQKWNGSLMKRSLRLNLNKKEVLTTEPNETTTTTISDNDLLRTELTTS